MHILVVDDEPMIRKALRRTFERAGHRVSEAADAKGALALLDGESYDAILVDHRMPGGGEQVVRHLKNSMGYQGPVILMTGALPEDVPSPEGVIRVQKPFNFRDILRLVEDA